MQVEGNIISVKRTFKSEDELLDLIESVHFGLPVVMSLEYVDVPVVIAVTGNLGGVDFVWAYTHYAVMMDVTTPVKQEQRLLESWGRLKLLIPGENRRLFAALNYFQIACRLAFVGASPWEFTGEIIINLAKVLEVLFPASASGSIDAARAGLGNLGYSPKDIEKWYVPVIALRNGVDVGHVALADLNQEQLQHIHDFTAHVEKAFRQLLTLVTERVAAGQFDFPTYETRDQDIERVVRRMSEHDYSKLDLESFS